MQITHTVISLPEKPGEQTESLAWMCFTFNKKPTQRKIVIQIFCFRSQLNWLDFPFQWLQWKGKSTWVNFFGHSLKYIFGIFFPKQISLCCVGRNDTLSCDGGWWVEWMDLEVKTAIDYVCSSQCEGSTYSPFNQLSWLNTFRIIYLLKCLLEHNYCLHRYFDIYLTYSQMTMPDLSKACRTDSDNFQARLHSEIML